MGISFYTFQTLSYTIDVYRGKIEPIRDFVTFAAYVSFFPQLVAGPIERAHRLLPQLQNERKLNLSEHLTGAALLGQGLFKKVVVADNLGFLVDYIFATPTDELSGAKVLIGVYAFAIQIYADFSGYTDIARGVSKCMGIDLMHNFDAPYFSQNPRDFWRRWHISLSTWLRDYLYISLGGNRTGKYKTYRNLMLTMLLGGLWHGAAWSFILWGLYHGVILSAHRFLSENIFRKKAAGDEPVSRATAVAVCLLKALLMFHVVCLGWLLFRGESISQIGGMLAALAGGLSFNYEARLMLMYLLHFSWVVIALQAAQFFSGEDLPARTGSYVRYAVLAYMLIHIVREGVFEQGTQFIYFQF